MFFYTFHHFFPLHHQTASSLHPVSLTVSFLISPILPPFISFLLFQPRFHNVYQPLGVSSPLQFSSPSLPVPPIGLDMHSPPGLNHQGLLTVAKLSVSVSPHGGFCLLAVETNDLHALCLLSPHPHLEALEPINVMHPTRRAAARSHCTRRPRRGLLCLLSPQPFVSCRLKLSGAGCAFS